MRICVRPASPRQFRWISADRLREPLIVTALLGAGAAVRALRFGGALHVWHMDDIRFAGPALDILGGALPVHVVGAGYAGASFSYLLAPAFWVGGASTPLVDVCAYVHGLALLGTGYMVARRLLDSPAVLFTLAVLAVPPLYLAQWSLNGTVGHPQALVFGNLFLVGTHGVFFRHREAAKRTLLGLGLLAGVGWWTNPMMAVYVLPFALLAFRTGLVWKPRIGLVVLGAVLGGMPQWIDELRYFPSPRFALMRAGAETPSTLPDRVHAIVSDFLPRLLGVDSQHMAPAVVVLGAVLVLLPWAGALVRALVRDRAELVWLVGLGGRPGNGGCMLWVLAAGNIALILGTTRPITPWYLLFLYSVLPYWMGELLAWLWRRRPALAVTALAGQLLFHLGTNWADSVGRVPAEDRRWAPLMRAVGPLVDRLEAQRITRLYWHVEAWPSFELTFLTGGRVISSDLWRNAVSAHGNLVDAAAAPPIVVDDGTYPASGLSAGLRAIGLSVRETRRGDELWFDAVPSFTHGFEPLPSEGWTVTASPNPQLAARLIDRDASTGWSTGDPMVAGEWIAADLGREEHVARVDLLSIDWQDIPAGYRVAVSRDGAEWAEVASVPTYWGPLFFSEHHAFLKVRRGRVQAIFPPTRARFVRIVQTGTSPNREWSARELFVYRPGRPRPPVPPDGSLAAALAREGVWFVYANHWLSARVLAEGRGRIGALEGNHSRNAYGGYTEPPAERIGPSRLGPGVGILVGSETDAEALREALRGQGVTWREATAGPYPLLVVTSRPPRSHDLSPKGWTATADENAELAALAIDGQVATSWAPATDGGRLTLDLGGSRRLSGLAVRTGPGPDIPRDVRLEASSDGRTWAPLGPLRWAGRIYWDGTQFLREGTGAWRVSFPQTEMRYLRLAVTAPKSAGWSVAEVRCYE